MECVALRCVTLDSYMSKVKYSLEDLQDGNGDKEQAFRAKRERREEEKRAARSFVWPGVQKERILA